MFKKFILIAGLSLSVFSIAHAEDLSLLQNINQTEETMTIMHGIEENHVAPQNIEKYLEISSLSDAAKNSVRVLLSSNIRFSDYIKVEKGVYILKSEKQQVNQSYPDHQCVSWSGLESCIYNAGKTCSSFSTNQCS